MKRILLLLFLFGITTNIVFSQESDNFRLSGTVEHFSLGSDNQLMFGLNGELFLSEKFSLNYKYTMGVNKDGDFVYHTPAGAIGVYFIDIWELMVFSVMIPEGVSYHQYPNKWLEVSPYLNPLGCEYNSNYNNLNLSCTAGVKLHIKADKFNFSPNVGVLYLYGHNDPSLNLGLSVGYLLN
ncbi:MAG: hypothetical protein HXX09_07160 [Bacteroidetes bacterium]|nr:hypothetical protein [Bacteroidota bacterium]